MSASPTVTRASVGLRSERGPLLLAVMLSTGLVAIDNTILATAVPQVVGSLGGFTQFPWLFSIYLLTTAVTVPIYGKLADLVGRKPIMLVGIGLFVGGSVLCGLAWSMTGLIVFRAIQGLGAGAVQPMAMTIVGDIYTMQERATVQGYIASVWAVASLVGPTLGGVFAQYVSWRAIFFVNVPLGLVASWMLVRSFHERVARHRASIDWLGALLLTIGGVVLLLALLEGGQRWAWDAPVSVLLFAVALGALVAFGYVERHVGDPVLPPWVLRRRVLNAANAGSLLVGMVMLGLSSYVPLFAQGVLGHGALVAGLALAGMSIGWPISSSQAGRMFLRWGFRATVLTGALTTLAGGLLLLTVGARSSIWHLGLPCFVMGLGFGLVVPSGVIAAQSSVVWASRGVATGANMFGRSLGSAVGVAVFGAVANGVVRHRLHGTVPALEQLGAGDLEPALHLVFVVAVAISVLLLVSGVAMPVRVHEQDAVATVTRQ
jgi:EmrB/QacA subfamily drug resistance transporter